MAEKLTQELFVERAVLKHGDKFDYSNALYGGSFVKVDIICKKHNKSFSQRGALHLRGQGCPICAREENVANRVIPKRNGKLTVERFIEMAQKIHGDVYDYSLISSVSTNTTVSIICPTHGLFTQNVREHIRGHGCKQCGVERRAQKKTGVYSVSFDDWLALVRKKFGDKYTYYPETYRGTERELKISCPEHGEYYQHAKYHLNGHGCQKCSLLWDNVGRDKILFNEFISRAKQHHGDKYHYTEPDDFSYSHSILTIICPEHGPFEQSASNHASRSGCQKCGAQKCESQNEWLDSIGVKIREYHINIAGRKYYADGFDPETNTIFEFYGDFWHGNPERFDLDKINRVSGKSFRELYFNTYIREELLILNGYNIVSIWETDWNKLKNEKNR